MGHNPSAGLQDGNEVFPFELVDDERASLVKWEIDWSGSRLARTEVFSTGPDGLGRPFWKDEQSLDDIAQLPDITGPGMTGEQSEHLIGENLMVVRVWIEQVDNGSGEIGNIPATVSQRGEVHSENRKPVEKILPETAVFHL